MKPVYTIEQLEVLKRPQLWEICEQLALPKYPASRTCIQAIMSKQPVAVDEQVIASNELEIYLEEQAVNVAETVQRLARTEDSVRPHAATNQDEVESLLEEVEVDEIPDQDFGGLCRLWHKTKLLGTFYRKIFTDDWVATPTDSIHPYHCPSDEDAKYWLVDHYLKTNAQRGGWRGQKILSVHTPHPTPNTQRLIGAASLALALASTVISSFPAYGVPTECDFRGSDYGRRREMICPAATVTPSTKPRSIPSQSPKPKPKPKPLHEPVVKDEFVPKNNGSPNSKYGTGTRV